MLYFYISFKHQWLVARNESTAIFWMVPKFLKVSFSGNTTKFINVAAINFHDVSMQNYKEPITKNCLLAPKTHLVNKYFQIF